MYCLLPLIITSLYNLLAVLQNLNRILNRISRLSFFICAISTTSEFRGNIFRFVLKITYVNIAVRVHYMRS